MIQRKDLTEEQEAAFQYILNFLKSGKRQMLLGGYAGTGKTTLIRVLLDHLDKGFASATCTAPTNEAVRVIAKLTRRKKFHQTIYSLLGLALVQEDDKPPILLPKSDSKLGQYDVVIIDEASMIQEELFDMIQMELNHHSHIQVIYIGDDAQLPPVKDEGKDSKVFTLTNTVKLVEVQRTAKENPIINIVTDMRNNLESSKDVFEYKTVMNDAKTMGVVFYEDRDEYLNLIYEDFKSDNYKEDSNFVRVLAYTNKTVSILNSMIRKQIFDVEDLQEYEKGENLIVDEPIVENAGQTILFTVGERLKVKDVSLQEDPEHAIKYWRLRVENYEESEPLRVRRNIKVVHKNYISNYRFMLTKYANEAKEKLRNSKNKVPKRIAWHAYFGFKNRFSWVKYSYATTVHKSQGSTFQNVYAINADCNKLHWNHVERNKLKYVAFTRPSNLLRII